MISQVESIGIKRVQIALDPLREMFEAAHRKQLEAKDFLPAVHTAELSDARCRQ